MERVTKEHLMADINVVLADAEELLKQAAQASSEQAAELRRRAQSAIANAKVKLVDMEHRVVDGTKHAARATDHWVHEHPWKAVGVAAAVGVLIGLLINRR
ncbi:MAG: DUF883 domain-containing protein [Betaproteobacteria bacterium]|nr:DUF883 domain-containing protein [Betaproteobacteria bacterium]